LQQVVDTRGDATVAGIALSLALSFGSRLAPLSRRQTRPDTWLHPSFMFPCFSTRLFTEKLHLYSFLLI